MKAVKLFALTVLSMMTMACFADKHAFEITVTGAEHFPEGARVLVYRPKTVEAPKPIEFLKDTPFQKDGVTIAGTVETPHMAALDIVPADSEYPIYRLHLALEPGKTEIHFTGKKVFTLKGGKYNKLLVNSWSDIKGYPAARLELVASIAAVPEGENPFKNERFRTANTTVNEMMRNAVTQAVDNSGDSLALLMASQTMYYKFPDLETRNDQIMSLCQELEGHRQATVALKALMADLAYLKTSSEVGVGTVTKDFTAESLDGEEFHLADVLKKNKYVLVEFWASWCGPCRAEIPHMKTAYRNFKNKGFEIVSFTLDDDREDWEDASEEEQIPWINTGDLLARTSPVVKMYGVGGLPDNYLVEGATGKIVAKNLRQEALDEKLAELLGH